LRQTKGAKEKKYTSQVLMVVSTETLIVTVRLLSLSVLWPGAEPPFGLGGQGDQCPQKILKYTFKNNFCTPKNFFFKLLSPQTKHTSSTLAIKLQIIAQSKKISMVSKIEYNLAQESFKFLVKTKLQYIYNKKICAGKTSNPFCYSEIFFKKKNDQGSYITT
jgi:hypothetical protein